MNDVKEFVAQGSYRGTPWTLYINFNNQFMVVTGPRPKLDPLPYVFQSNRYAEAGEPNSRVGWGDRAFKPREGYSQNREDYLFMLPRMEN